MNGADSEPRRQLPTTAAREDACSATRMTSVQCRRWRPYRNRIFCDQSYFSRFPVTLVVRFPAFCLCFHFKSATGCDWLRPIGRRIAGVMSALGKAAIDLRFGRSEYSCVTSCRQPNLSIEQSLNRQSDYFR